MNNENNDLNNQVGQPVKTNNGKNNKGYLFVILILLILVIVLSILLVKNPFNKDSNADKNDNGSVENNNDGQVENKETKLTDTIKINHVKELVGVLEDIPFDISNVHISDNKRYFNDKKSIYALDNVKLSDITNTMATKALLHYTFFTSMLYTSTVNTSMYKSTPAFYIDRSDLEKPYSMNIEALEYCGGGNLYAVYINDIKPLYKELFNLNDIDLTVGKTGVDFGGATYFYNNQRNLYYMCVSGGSGGTSASPETYIYDITEDNKNIYVYVAYGAIYLETVINGDDKLTYYTDYTLTNEYTKEVKKENFINETNYQDFDKYKYTFTKNSDGTYTFSSISKIK